MNCVLCLFSARYGSADSLWNSDWPIHPGGETTVFLGAIIQALSCPESIRPISDSTSVFGTGSRLHHRTRTDEYVFNTWRPYNGHCLCESPMEVPAGFEKHTVSSLILSNVFWWLLNLGFWLEIIQFLYNAFDLFCKHLLGLKAKGLQKPSTLFCNPSLDS